MVSNKSLAVLIIAAVVISLGGTIINLNKLNQFYSLKNQESSNKEFTGLATGTGYVNLSITSSARCGVDTNVSFGSSGQPSVTYSLTSDKDNSLTTTFQNCTDAASTNNCKGIQINNTGNVNLNLTFTSNVDATSLLGSQTGLSSADFRYWIINGSTTTNASQGCRNFTNGTTQLTAGTQINMPTYEQQICNNLTFTDGNDVMHLEFNVTLQPDILPTTKTATLTFNCQQNIGLN